MEPPILFAPSEAPPPGAQQRRMVSADLHRLAAPAPGNAVAPERAPRAVLVQPSGAQCPAPRALRNVVLRVAAETAHGHPASGRLPLRRDRRIDPPPLEAAAALPQAWPASGSAASTFLRLPPGVAVG